MQYPKLKPQLLRSLIADHLPEANTSSFDPLKLPLLISSIKLHGLLSEHCAGSPDEKLQNDWQAAVNLWIERLLLLSSSELSDKRWVSVTLLGVTCQECSGPRFLMSYSSWFDKLLELLKMPLDSHFIKVSCCAALSDLFMRLYRCPTYKKEGASLSNKLIPSALELLTEGASDDILEAAVGLLCNLVNLFPSSFHRHYDNAETVLATFLSRSSSSAVSKMFAQLLAFLPRAKGDAVSWSQMITKVLISINTHLNYVFRGLEDENKGMNIINLLVERGTEPPPPLGGYLEAGERQAKYKFGNLHIPCVCTLIQCCITMLTSPYHIQVSVPVQPLLALTERMLSLDGNNCYASTPVMASTQLEFLFSDLLMLHLSGLDLLDAIIKSVRSQLLPATGKIVRLLQSCFRRFSLPSIRVKLYEIAKALLISMNAGMAPYFASDIIDNASRDLNCGIQGHGFISFPMLSSKHGTEVSNVTKKRKRKLASGAPEDDSNAVKAEFSSDQPNVPFSVLISALQAIEALLMVGGSLHSQSWRPTVDLLLMRVASSVCEEGWSFVSDIVMEAEGSFSWADFQLAALKALLASLLSPCTHRPPYLSYGLALFRKGKQEAGTQIADFCAHALLALEPLIHPRSLQLISPPLGGNGGFSRRSDFPVNENREPHVPFSQEQNPDFPRTNWPSMKNCDKQNLPIDVADIYPDDKLCMGWLANMEENDSDTLDNRKEVQVDCQIESTCKLNTVEKMQCCSVVNEKDILKENTRNTSLAPQTQVTINATAGDKSTLQELKGHGLQPPVHIKEGNPSETLGDESKDIELLKPVASPSKVVASAGVSDIVSEDLPFNRFSSWNSEEFAKMSSDSESLPDIVVGDPDSD